MATLEGKPSADPASLAALAHVEREELVRMLSQLAHGGIFINFYGKRSALEIAKRVRPRVTRRIKELHVGPPEEQCKNLLIEGENLQAMVTLYKYRGQVDLVLTDPPYNTGGQFRYNDRWDEDPNDPDLGQLVGLEDGSRHTKWLKAMMPRLQMMRSMLKPNGVIAICIDENELFHLGMMMDEVFGEANRLAIINWEKAHAPKNDARHVSTATEYVLVYANDKPYAKTHLLPRGAAMDSGFRNPDRDPNGAWVAKDPTAREHRTKTAYAVQSPFTGRLHYPNGEYSFDGKLPEARAHWTGVTRNEMLEFLEEWGTKYEERNLNDDRGLALVIAGSKTRLNRYSPDADPAVQAAIAAAMKRYAAGDWPRLYFRDDQQRRSAHGRPRVKVYPGEIKKGLVPTTYWAEDEYTEPFQLDAQSWDHTESGHTDGAKKELDAIVGPAHGFATVKPLRLMKKIIQLWCPPNGLVLDPYAGSGTTAHAVLELNHEVGSDRRFVVVEQGQNGDKYARSLTWRRVRNAITGERPDGKGRFRRTAPPLGGGFEFRSLTSQIDAKTVMSMKRDELIDVVMTSYWDANSRNAPNLVRIEEPSYVYLVGRNERNEGYFLIWTGEGPVGQLDVNTYREVLSEGKRAGLVTPYHVYARYEVYQSQNVLFYKIPDKILAHLGLNEASDRYNEDALADE